MGNTYLEQTKKGYRILNIEPESPSDHTDLQLLVDYVVQPEIHGMSLSQDVVQLQVYSLIDQKIRSVNVKLGGRALGLTVRVQIIKDVLLKVVNVFKGSPLQKVSVQIDDYIVGMVQQAYSSLKGFTLSVKNEFQTTKKPIHIGVYNVKTGFRMVKIQYQEYIQWKKKGRGMLGCELTQGWLHRLPAPSTQPDKPFSHKPVHELAHVPSHQDHLQSIDKQMQRFQTMEQSFQQTRLFKGKLRCEVEQDSQLFCRCNPVDKYCQSCSYHKNGVTFFYSQKLNKVYGIQDSMLFTDVNNNIIT